MRGSQADAATSDKRCPARSSSRRGRSSAENPVPRRSYHVPPDDPFANDPGSVAFVTLRLTLDGSGQVAEYRAVRP